MVGVSGKAENVSTRKMCEIIRANAENRSGAIDSLTIRAYSASCLGHSIFVSTNHLHKPNYGINIYQIPSHFLSCSAPQRYGGLDDCTAKGLVSLDRPHPRRISHDEHEDEPRTLGEYRGNGKRSSGSGWTRPNIRSQPASGRGICCLSGKCGRIHHHSTFTSTISIQVVQSKISGTQPRTWLLDARYSVLQGHERDENLEGIHQPLIQSKNHCKEDDLGRSLVLEIPRSNNNSSLFKGVPN